MNGIGGVGRAMVGYGRQQLYAERAATLRTPKTIQVSAVDRVSFTAEGVNRAATIAAAAVATAAAPSRYDAPQTARQIYYDNPRRTRPMESAAERPVSAPEATGGGETGFVEGIFADKGGGGHADDRRSDYYERPRQPLAPVPPPPGGDATVDDIERREANLIGAPLPVPF
jgi:hypothetical protein